MSGAFLSLLTATTNCDSAMPTVCCTWPEADVHVGLHDGTRNAQVATVRHPTLALGDGARASRLAADARRVLLRLA